MCRLFSFDPQLTQGAATITTLGDAGNSWALHCTAWLPPDGTLHA